MLYFKSPETGQIFGYETIEERDQFGSTDLEQIDEAQAISETAPPFEFLRAGTMELFRVSRELYLNRLAGIMVAAQLEDDQETATAALAMRRGLLDLPATDAVEDAESIDELEAALKDGYAALVAAVPAKLRVEFLKVQS